jgi:RNA 2',3'-cyclic 3'-phosphodiesterase
MRAFVALIPPTRALTELADAVTPVRDAHPDLRWAPAAQLHLTLAFLGEVDEAVLPELTERLARAARRHSPVLLALAGVGRFGDRVLWTRVQLVAGELRVPPRRVAQSGTASSASGHGAPRGGADALRRLAGSVAAAARRSGIAVDDRPYRPHLTLARGRGGADLRPAAAALAGFAGSPWTADALHLVRSRLGAGPGGTAVHEIVRTWPLGQ